MRRFFKVMLIGIACILALVVLMVTCTVSGVKQLAKAPLYTGTHQTVTVTAAGATVTTSIQPQKQIVLSGVQLCMPFPQGINFTSMCPDNACETVIDYPAAPLAKDLVVHRNYGGQCVEQTIPNIEQYAVTNYRGVIGLEAPVTQQLQIPAGAMKVTKTAHSQFSDSSLVGFNGTVKVELYYRAASPQQDEFMLGGTKMITVQYALSAPATPVQPQ